MRSFQILAVSVFFLWTSLSHGQVTEEAIIRDTASQIPNRVVFDYDFDSPIRRVEIEMTRDPQSRLLLSANVRFGSHPVVKIPGSVLGCFPEPQIEQTGFQFSAVDKNYPKPSDRWWSSVLILYGKVDQNDAVPNPTVQFRLYPYLQVEFVSMKLSRLVIHRSAKEFRVITLPVDKCPTEDISWSLAGP